MAVSMIGVCHASESAEAGPPAYGKPSFLGEYDFATRADLKLTYLLRPLVSGDLATDWPLLEGVEDQLGEWINQFLSAPQIAETITQAMPTKGQPALRQINELVEECCEVLHVEKPVVFVRNHVHTNAYVTRAGNQNFLVLTSGLLRLYEGRPEELRFVIGHELGHLKCGHLQTLRAAYGVQVAVQSVNLAVVKDKYQVVLPTLALGRLFNWRRESEISADRAGLLCCQDPQVAYNALQRLLSGLAPGSPWIDPDTPDFNSEVVLKQFRHWENEPFVELVMFLKRQTAESPFIPERLAALKTWAESGDYQVLLERRSPPGDEQQIVVIKSITVTDVCEEGMTVDPYLIAYREERELFKTTVASGMRSARWKALDYSHACRNGQPLQFEVWDSNVLGDSLIGGFMIFPVNPRHDPDRGSTTYTTNLVWSWKERSPVTRTGVATVEVEFRERAK